MSSGDDQAEFLARLQHGLRTPLTAIIGMGELAADYWDQWDDKARREMFADSLIAAEHLYRLTDSITDPLMVASSGWQPEMSVTSMDAVLLDATAVVRRRCGEEAVVTVDSADLPEIRADAARLSQALAELLENAVNNAAEGTPVTVTARCDGDTMSVEIINRGDTIPAEKIDDYFKPFVRGTPSPRRRFNGLGMGLPIARRIARAHGGDVTLTSADGVTTARFVIRTGGEGR